MTAFKLLLAIFNAYSVAYRAAFILCFTMLWGSLIYFKFHLDMGIWSAYWRSLTIASIAGIPATIIGLKEMKTVDFSAAMKKALDKK